MYGLCTVTAPHLIVGQAASGVVPGCDATNTRFTSFTRFTIFTRSNDFPERFCPRLMFLWLSVFASDVFLSQSPDNLPAALFRRRAGPQVGVFMGSNGGWGTMSFEDPPPMAF